MGKVSLLFVIGFFSFVPLRAEGTKRIMEGLTMTSAILGQEIKFSIVLPTGYFKGSKNYPVVYLLHGLGDDESSWLEYGRISQIADEAIGAKQIVPMIFVMPQGFRNYYVNDYAGTFLYEDMFIKELVPFIDKQYRTIPDSDHRAVLGCSMGGFGALVLPMKHPDVFSVSVPLSISVRTDAQYMVEDASEWNDQWGRLFGGVGTIGKDRITKYYQQYSPFHVFPKMEAKQWKHLKLFIDIGDDEYTLCRSNEELHILLRDLQVPHEFRVREGGHEFSYWRDALQNGLHFISDSFEGKTYRGDEIPPIKKVKYPKVSFIDEESYVIALPPGYDESSRQYPVVYLIGDLDAAYKQTIAGLAHREMNKGLLPPLILVFLKGEASLEDADIPELELKYNARNGYRFRALIGFGDKGGDALQYAMMPETFTSCVLFDSPLDTTLLKAAIASNKSSMKKTWLCISTSDTSKNYKTNGMAHILLREEDVYHEYRVVDGDHESDLVINQLSEAFHFTSEKIHR
jgi:enterochelin esterase-like enzyme